MCRSYITVSQLLHFCRFYSPLSSPLLSSPLLSSPLLSSPLLSSPSPSSHSVLPIPPSSPLPPLPLTPLFPSLPPPSPAIHARETASTKKVVGNVLALNLVTQLYKMGAIEAVKPPTSKSQENMVHMEEGLRCGCGE